MSESKLPIHLLQELPDITVTINSPLKSAQRIKYTCFDVSKNHIAFGATSGGIYVFSRQPCEFIQLIPSKDGAITKLSISPDEKKICFANGRGIVTVTECEPNLSGGRKTVTCKEHQGNEVTSIVWSSCTAVFSGDDVGRVCVTMIHNFLPKNIFQSGSQTIMSLDSRICQLDTKDVMLLVSTLTRCYICDTSQEQYRQIGQKLRDGEYGACFVTKEMASEFTVVNDVANKCNEVKKYNIVNGEEAFAVNEKLHNTFIYCARPSSRLWEANITGTVEKTHQYKQALSKKPTKIVSIETHDSQHLEIERLTEETDGVSTNFPKIYSIKNDCIFSFKKDVLYFLNLENIEGTIWLDCLNDIQDCKIYKDLLYVWRQNGSLLSFRFMKIDKYVLKCFLDEKYELCCNLCALYSGYFLNEKNKLYNKLSILIGLRDKVSNEKITSEIDAVLTKFESLKEEANSSKSGIKIVQNIHQTRKLFSDDQEDLRINLEKQMTLKDISSTVTDKLNTSKEMIKEKWNDLEEKFKNLATERNLEADVNKKVLNGNLKLNENKTKNNLHDVESCSNGLTDSALSNDKEDIIYKKSSQEETEQIIENFNENNSLDDSKDDKNCKALYQFYKISTIKESKDEEKFKSILDHCKGDIKQTYNLMLMFQEYCIQIGAFSESEFVPNDLFLFYINTSENKDAILNQIITDENLYKYFVNSCIAVNSKSQKIANIGCECGFPLPFVQTNLTPEYNTIIDTFIEKQWFSKSPDQFYEVCRKMPYLWRRIIHLRRNEDLQNLLKILLQILDENLLHSFLPQFTIETWEKAIQLYAILQCNECLNCGKKFDHISVKNTLSWDVIGRMVIKSIGARNALKVIEKHIELIEKAELTIRFYHSCMLVCLFEKYDGTVRNQLVDTVYASYGNDEAVEEICALLRSTNDGTLKNTSLPLIVAVQSKHWGLENIRNNILETKNSQHSQHTQNDTQSSQLNPLEAQKINLEDLLGYFRRETSNTDCDLCGLPFSNEVLIKDGGLWVFKCGHIFHGACLELNKIKLCPSCK